MEGDRVAFTAKDDTAGGRRRVVQLTGAEFLRRWVQHVLPRGFVKIRHYGLLANRGRTERRARCRALLAVWTVVQMVVGILGSGADRGGGPRRCPACGAEAWWIVAEWPRPAAVAAGAEAAGPDTS